MGYQEDADRKQLGQMKLLHNSSDVAIWRLLFLCYHNSSSTSGRSNLDVHTTRDSARPPLNAFREIAIRRVFHQNCSGLWVGSALDSVITIHV